jgi:hypothetical protein
MNPIVSQPSGQNRRTFMTISNEVSPAGEIYMSPLTQYLQLIVEPTAEEFINNPLSLRHCFLACVAIFHAIDRAADLQKVRAAHLRQVWANESADFKIVDIVAHDFKHLKAGNRTLPPNRAKMSFSVGVYGKIGYNVHVYNETGKSTALRNLVHVVKDALAFIRVKAEALESQAKDQF